MLKLLTRLFDLIILSLALHASGQTIHVMAYNIHHGCDANEKPQLKQLADLIKKSKAEVVGLEEVDSVCKRSGSEDQAKVLAELTGMHYGYVRHFAFDGGSYGLALLSKYPVSGVTNSRIPVLTYENGDSTRALLVAQVQVSAARQIMVAVAHLDYRSEESRVRQASIIVDLCKENSGPVLLIGDLNAEPAAASITRLKELFADANGANSLTFPSDAPKKKIDYILVNKSHFKKTIQEPVYNVKYSDHLPVSAYIQYR